MGIVCSRLAASRSHRRVTISTARRGDLPFVPAKGSKTGSRGTDSPLTNPFLSLAVLDTNDAKHRPYCAQIRSQGSRRRICPLPVPLPRSGGGAVWANSCLFKFRSRQRDFLRCTPWPIGSPCRLAVPEKIFALLACSIFSTATDAPPRCIRHWRCSAPHPHPPRPPHSPKFA